MTINSVQTLFPGRLSINSTEKSAAKPPPKTYPVREPPFRGYLPPQADGFERSRSNPDSSAIVIDNGKCIHALSNKGLFFTDIPCL